MKRSLTDILSRIISIVFYPLFVPTYGMALFCYGLSLRVPPLPSIYWTVGIIGTFVFTCFIPMSIILYMLYRKQVKDLDMSDPKERQTPYLYAICGFAAWAVFIAEVMKMPSCMLWTAIGATIVLVIVSLINRKWKISAHSAGIGGMVGGVMSFCLFYSLLPIGLIMASFAVSLLILYARLQANAHTPLQVVAGYLLGIFGTFLPNLIVSYA